MNMSTPLFPMIAAKIAAEPVAEAAPRVAETGWFSEWTWVQWLLFLLVLLVVVFVLYLVVRLVIHRVRMHRMVGTMREDLLLRRELADMAGGKDIKAQRREQFLRTESIRMDVQSAVNRMRENAVEPRRTGCWLMLGEPGSGKGRLMQYGGMEFPAGLNDFSGADEPTSTFKLWMCAKGAIWDIGGRLFLNRWGGLQDNEWRVFLEEFRKVYRNSLPSGLVLALPADALLRDDAALRDRKISLIAEEMRALVHVTGAYCPVWVVVTKCDMLPGFSEFCSLLDNAECEQALGWYNRNPRSSFDPAASGTAFDALVERLRVLRNAYALNTSVWDKTASGTDRADTMAPVYLMPERFADMKDSLQHYLSGIFTCVQHRAGHGGNLFQFCGCWFTAALDKPVTSVEHVLLENRDGKLQPVVVPQAMGSVAMPGWQDAGNSTGLVTVREKIVSTASPRHYFTADLLNKVIVGAGASSDYTAVAVGRIRRPYWVASAVLVGLALPLALWALATRPALESLAERDYPFWESTRDQFRRGDVAKSPILVADKDRQVGMNGHPVPATGACRREYLYSMNNMATLPARLPWFWRPASWAVDHEFSPNLLSSSKLFIDKAALVTMVLKPAVDSSREVLTYRAERDRDLASKWYRRDTDCLSALLKVTRYGIDVMENRAGQDDRIPYMDLVHVTDSPAKDSAIKSLWLHSGTANPTLSLLSPLNGYLRPVSIEAALAISKAVALYVSEVDTLEVYPELNYVELSRFATALDEMRRLRDEMNALVSALSSANGTDREQSPEELITCWKERYARLCVVREQVQAGAAKLNLNRDAERSLRAVADGVQSELSARLIEDQNAFNRLLVGLSDSPNSDFLRGQVALMHDAIGRAMPRLGGEYKLVTDALCAFWDVPEDAGDSVRPCDAFCTYADAMNKLFTAELPAGDASERFNVRILRVEDRRKKLDDGFETLKKLNPNLGDTCKEVVWNLMLGSVLNRWLDEAPHSNVELMRLIDANLPARSLPDAPYTVAGKAKVRCCYEPANAQRVLEDMGALTAFADKYVPLASTETALQLSPKLTTVREAADHYRSDYLLYWLDEIPSYYRLTGIRTWQDFVRSGEVFYNSDAADSIGTVYRMQLEALSIPVLAGEDVYPELAAKRQGIQAVMESLSSGLMRKMERSAEFFSSLDSNPRKAWQTLQDMPAQDYVNAWWGAWFKDMDGVGLGLWNDYLVTGMTLLKREAATALQQEAGLCMPMAAMFPLSSSAGRGPGQVLGVYDMEDLMEKLEGAYNAPDPKRRAEEAKQAETLGAPPSIVSLELPMKRKRERALQDVHKVIDLVASPDLPLNCVPVLPALDTRSAPLSGEDSVQRVIPVGRRFPYMRILCKGRALTGKMNLNRANEKDLDLSATPLGADAADLEFEFYRHSTSSAPDASFKLAGAWSPLNLYLRQGARLGDDKKTAYIPVVFRDKEGYTCLFWTGLRFNREMIAPDEWPGAAVFETAPTDPAADRKDKERQLRKAIRDTFLSRHNVHLNPGAEARARLLEDVEALQKDGCAISFEIVTPGMVTGDDNAATRAASRFPYFSLGTELESSGKLRAMPETSRTAPYAAPSGEPAVLRLFRHAEDEFSTLYTRTEGSLLHYVMMHATEYSATDGYFTVPFKAAGNGESVEYTIYLRPVLSPTYDDGLLPEDSLFPATVYPSDVPPVD